MFGHLLLYNVSLYSILTEILRDNEEKSDLHSKRLVLPQMRIHVARVTTYVYTIHCMCTIERTIIVNESGIVYMTSTRVTILFLTLFSQTSSVCEFVGETKSEEDSSFEYSLPNVSVDLSRQLSETNQSPTCTSNQSHVTTIHNSSVGDRETTGSNDSCKDDNDESESEDEKLEKCK